MVRKKAVEDGLEPGADRRMTSRRHLISLMHGDRNVPICSVEPLHHNVGQSTPRTHRAGLGAARTASNVAMGEWWVTMTR